MTLPECSTKDPGNCTHYPLDKYCTSFQKPHYSLERASRAGCILLCNVCIGGAQWSLKANSGLWCVGHSGGPSFGCLPHQLWSNVRACELWCPSGRWPGWDSALSVPEEEAVIDTHTPDRTRLQLITDRANGAKHTCLDHRCVCVCLCLQKANWNWVCVSFSLLSTDPGCSIDFCLCPRLGPLFVRVYLVSNAYQ